jgi:hypothetical protein
MAMRSRSTKSFVARYVLGREAFESRRRRARDLLQLRDLARRRRGKGSVDFFRKGFGKAFPLSFPAENAAFGSAFATQNYEGCRVSPR